MTIRKCGSRSKDHVWVNSAYRVFLPGTSGDRRSPTKRMCSRCGRREHKGIFTKADGRKQGLWYLTAHDHASAPNASRHPRVLEHLSRIRESVTDKQFAYLAGLVDGDGCIRVRARERGPSAGDRRRRVGLTPLVIVSGEPGHLRGLLKEMRSVGGRVNTTRGATDRWREVAEWIVAGTRACALMLAMLPHLRLKLPQAKVVLSMPMPRSRWASTPALRKKQNEVRDEIRRLNKRGPKKGR